MDMSETEPEAVLEAAVDAYRAAPDTFYRAVSDAYANGMRQVDIVRITGLTRERVRQICALATFERDGWPTIALVENDPADLRENITPVAAADFANPSE